MYIIVYIYHVFCMCCRFFKTIETCDICYLFSVGEKVSGGESDSCQHHGMIDDGEKAMF